MPIIFSGFAIVIIVANLLGCIWLIRYSSKTGPQDAAVDETTGHSWDGDLTELNNPLPRWWLYLFYLTIVYAFVYMLIYGGLGHYKGTGGWSQTGQWEAEIKAADSRYAAYFSKFRDLPLSELAANSDAVATGSRVFANNCATCHGSDARGARGYPNLSDNDWLYGNAPDTVLTTILKGRNGVMPPLGAALGGEAQVTAMAEYVLALGTPAADAAPAATRQQFATVCAACHLPTGTGMQALGAPNLTDDIWLHGGSVEAISATINNGINNAMPAHGKILGEDKSRLAAAYVLSLSAGQSQAGGAP